MGSVWLVVALTRVNAKVDALAETNRVQVGIGGAANGGVGGMRAEYMESRKCLDERSGRKQAGRSKWGLLTIGVPNDWDLNYDETSGLNGLLADGGGARNRRDE